MNTDIADLIAGALGVSRGTAYDMMREALAEAQQQEPVAWMGVPVIPGRYKEAVFCSDKDLAMQWDYGGHLGLGRLIVTPLYTSPQPAQRKPLTDDQIMEMYNEPRSDSEMLEFARAIEAAHGIKGDA